MAVSYRVTVHRTNLAAMFRGRGEANTWIYSLSSRMISAARTGAPNRTGSLAAAHRIARGSRWGNAYQSRYTIENVSPHAEYVHEGTNGATSESGFMILGAGGPGRNTVSPYAGQSFPRIKKMTVRGQAPNPWLEEACVKVGMRAGAMIVAQT